MYRRFGFVALAGLLAYALPHDRCGRFKPNADAAALVDISALGGNSTDDIRTASNFGHRGVSGGPGRRNRHRCFEWALFALNFCNA